MSAALRKTLRDAHRIVSGWRQVLVDSHCIPDADGNMRLDTLQDEPKIEVAEHDELLRRLDRELARAHEPTRPSPPANQAQADAPALALAHEALRDAQEVIATTIRFIGDTYTRFTALTLEPANERIKKALATPGALVAAPREVPDAVCSRIMEYARGVEEAGSIDNAMAFAEEICNVVRSALSAPQAPAQVAAAVADVYEECAKIAEGASLGFDRMQALIECRDDEVGYHRGRVIAAKDIRARIPADTLARQEAERAATIKLLRDAAILIESDRGPASGTVKRINDLVARLTDNGGGANG